MENKAICYWQTISVLAYNHQQPFKFKNSCNYRYLQELLRASRAGKGD